MASSTEDRGDRRDPWLRHIKLGVSSKGDSIFFKWQTMSLKPSDSTAMRSKLGPRASDIFDKIRYKCDKISQRLPVDVQALPIQLDRGMNIAQALFSGTRIVVLTKKPENGVDVYEMEEIGAWLEKALNDSKDNFSTKFAPRLTLLEHRKVQPGAKISHPYGNDGRTVELNDGAGGVFHLRGSLEKQKAGNDGSDGLWVKIDPQKQLEQRSKELEQRFEELKRRQEELEKAEKDLKQEEEQIRNVEIDQTEDVQALVEYALSMEREFHQVLGLRLPRDHMAKKKAVELKRKIEEIEKNPSYIWYRNMWSANAHITSLKPQRVFVSLNIDGILRVHARKQFYRDVLQEACTDTFGPGRWLEDQNFTVNRAIEKCVDTDVDSKIFEAVREVIENHFGTNGKDGQKAKIKEKMLALKKKVVELAASKEKKQREDKTMLPIEVKKGFEGLLCRFREQKVTVGVVSGNWPELAWSKLERTSIVRFFKKDISGFGDCSSLKEAVEHARKCAEQETNSKFDIVMHIGHTKCDEHAAKEADQETIPYVLKVSELGAGEFKEIFKLLKLRSTLEDHDPGSIGDGE